MHKIKTYAVDIEQFVRRRGDHCNCAAVTDGAQRIDQPIQFNVRWHFFPLVEQQHNGDTLVVQAFHGFLEENPLAVLRFFP